MMEDGTGRWLQGLRGTMYDDINPSPQQVQGGVFHGSQVFVAKHTR